MIKIEILHVVLWHTNSAEIKGKYLVLQLYLFKTKIEHSELNIEL